MTKFNYFRAAAAVGYTIPGNVEHNVDKTLDIVERLVLNSNPELILFPELNLTGYTCADLFGQSILLNAVENGLEKIRKKTNSINSTIVVGAPLRYNSALYNCAVILSQGKYVAVIPKTYLPNNNEFYEKRWFASGFDITKNSEIEIASQKVCFGTDILIKQSDAIIGVELCEDLWAPIPPSSFAALNGANIILNLSASNELIGKHEYLKSIIVGQSAKCRSAYVYASAGRGESTTDLVFSGNAIIAENGKILTESVRFDKSNDEKISVADIDVELLQHDRINASSFNDALKISKSDYRIINISKECVDGNPTELLRYVDPAPFVPANDKYLTNRCSEIISIQVEGLMHRLEVTGCKNLVVGISGGLDSTLALLIAVEAFKRLNLDLKGIVGITMPGFGTTSRTKTNARLLMEQLGVEQKEIPISAAVLQHFKDIGQSVDKHDVTYENSQARERTQILMDYANKVGGMVLGTGDLSELALGWCTYNGDHMSMYAVNASIPKTLVRHIVSWFAKDIKNEDLSKTLIDIVATPISPELIPADESGNIKQKTEDLVGPYDLHDFFLYNLLRHGFSPSKIYNLACIAFNAKEADAKFDEQCIKKWIKIFFRRFFNQQFKRSCMPDGPKVGSSCLSPRGDWRMPSDASSAIWLKECDEL